MLDPTGNDYETTWYGTYSPGYDIYNPGSTMALRYEGTYNYDGFQLVYFQADPGKPVLWYLNNQRTHFKDMPEFFTARVRSTREGNVLTSICPSIHPSVCPQGGVRYPPGGVQVPPGGGTSPPGGVRVPPGGVGGSGVRVPPGGVQVPPQGGSR